MNNQLRTQIIGLIACTLYCGCDGSMETPSGGSRYGTLPGGVYHLNRFHYGTITFVFHRGDGMLSDIILAPNGKEGGPFIHLSDGSVVDLAKFTFDDDQKLLASIAGEKFNPDGYPPNVRHNAEHGRREFSREGELISTVFRYDILGRLDGPAISRTRDEKPLKLFDLIKLRDVKAAWGEPDRAELDGETNNRPKK